MKMLEDRIRKDGIVREGNVLKVDSFINHQMDIPLFREMAREWKRLFAGKPINKVLTIEASGIGIAAVVASELNVPVVFAKKSMSINLDYDNYKTQIQSFTHKKIYNVIVSKKFLTPEDHVLIIDDFLANGCALMGLLELAEEAGAPDIERKVLFLQELLNTTRSFAPSLFDGNEGRMKVLDAVQDAVDAAIAEEDAWLAEQG